MEKLRSIIYENNLSELKNYLQYNDINFLDDEENTLLHYAILYKRIEITYYLIDNHIFVNQVNKEGMTPLFLAVHLNMIMIVDALLKNNANPNLLSSGETPFFHACRLGRSEIISLFIEYGAADFSFVNEKGENYLFALIRSNNLALFKKYYNKELLLVKDKIDNTLLHLAVIYGNEELVSFLISEGIDVNYKNAFLETPLFIAIENKQYKIAKKLLKLGAITDFKNKEGISLLNLVKSNGLFDYDMTDLYRKNYPLHYAIIINNDKIFKENLNIYQINRRDLYNKLPIELANSFKRRTFFKEIKAKLSQNLSHRTKK